MFNYYFKFIEFNKFSHVIDINKIFRSLIFVLFLQAENESEGRLN